MYALDQKIQSLYTFEIDTQAIDLLAIVQSQSDRISILETRCLELKSSEGYWRAMHAKALIREKKLQQIIKEQKGQIKDLRNRVFGKKSEKKRSKKNNGKSKEYGPKRPRGQQPGSKGHGFTEHPDLPIKREESEFSEHPVCSKCGKLYIPSEDKETDRYEVQVKAHVRRIKRQSMIKGCTCKGGPKIVTAPMPPNVIPKSPYGISIWEAVLITKFQYSQPTNRLLNQYAELGLNISPGTIAGGLKKLQPLFQPVYDALYNRQMSEDMFHNDESGWKVFENVDGKIGNRWWLWVSRSESVVYFQIAQGRGADVPMEYFANIQQQKIIVICDRYSAYKSLAKQMPQIILAFCWAHVRRDFLDAARKYSELEDWSLYWIERIAELYHINNQRCKEFDPKLPVPKQSTLFNELHGELVTKMDAMVQKRDDYINAYKPEDPDLTLLSTVKFKILTSLKNHWDGLSVFVDHPFVPMDNNPGEKSIRNPVTGKKNFYGSGSEWSSKLAAMMFSIFQTMGLWKINRNNWLRAYLTACAENHGKAPENLSSFLPWEMDEKRIQELSFPTDSS